MNEQLRKLEKALRSEPMRIGKIHADKPSSYEVPSVYFISRPKDKGIVYVGKTQSKTVLGRIKDHRSISTNSDMKGMLKNNPAMTQDVDEYFVRMIRLDDDKERGHFEHFAIGVLKPALNK